MCDKSLHAEQFVFVKGGLGDVELDVLDIPHGNPHGFMDYSLVGIPLLVYSPHGVTAGIATVVAGGAIDFHCREMLGTQTDKVAEQVNCSGHLLGYRGCGCGVVESTLNEVTGNMDN
jgi:hypothetical protein